MQSKYDVLVIGGGSAGMAAAKRAASRDAEVALLEDRSVGGTCVARGCMPKKFLYYASRRMKAIHAGGPAGIRAEATEVNWSDVIDHELAVVDDLIDANRGGVEAYDDIDLIEGHATLRDDSTVGVDGETLSADYIILATGSRPNRPSIEGRQYGITSDEFLRDHTLPYSMAIVGGGYISVEFASILNAFGVDVTIFQRPDQLIPIYDQSIADSLEDQFEERGIRVHTGCEVTEIDKSGRSYLLQFDGEQTGSFTADRVLLAVGRQPVTEDLGLENVDVETEEDGSIQVDDRLRTNTEAIYAVGDVNGRAPFTPAAIREGKTAVDNALLGAEKSLNYNVIPTAVFTTPEVGSVGLSETEARERFEAVQVAEKSFTPFSAAVQRQSEEVFIKLIYTGAEKRLAGLHVLGRSASEIVQGFALAMKKSVTQEDLKDFPGVHPTVAEEVFSTKPE